MKLVSGLRDSLPCPVHFDKVNGASALKLFSKSIVAGLTSIIEKYGRSHTWTPQHDSSSLPKLVLQHMMTEKSILALSLKNMKSYNSFLDKLKWLPFLVKNVQGNGCGNPVQTGLIMSTTALLEIQQVLLQERGLEFSLTSRFSQDCL